ncbi:hypothetical protein G4V39_10680 [Thermosulfuriphilus ammonigenes]|uniref:Cytochrome c-type protein n=1 Tax=Thermosulfuriphilus ammonigenes TaxID=1936021 RepID=A0A6G7PYH5_9BACT|nr:NapC/NirT family cytochrome c [Thermosulfuriphilus ammonigenes]MBA2849024.1 nitrate/TMAO reductase-like tetraheme cytochrome c subunit [Thermosulfuriphilus ammonigenes]QIJ72712.1 hypothetical protein G4V39_10680 [Thermosulfuriphilus ammonigenes]
MGHNSSRGTLVKGLIIGFIAALVFSFITAVQVKSTGTVKFCSSCHEMKIFQETWAAGAHGPNDKGVIKAKCVDCHLPHDGLFTYLVAKTKFGINDYVAHVTGRKATLEHWLKHWEHKKPYTHEAYESGCRKCHKELVAPGIPLKAFTAHRAYELGETNKTCINCHHTVGHGDLLLALREGVSKDKSK